MLDGIRLERWTPSPQNTWSASVKIRSLSDNVPTMFYADGPSERSVWMRLGIGSYAYRWAVGTSTFQPKQPLLLPKMIMGTAALGCTLLQIADSEGLVTMSRTRPEGTPWLGC